MQPMEDLRAAYNRDPLGRPLSELERRDANVKMGSLVAFFAMNMVAMLALFPPAVYLWHQIL